MSSIHALGLIRELLEDDLILKIAESGEILKNKNFLGMIMTSLISRKIEGYYGQILKQTADADIFRTAIKTIVKKFLGLQVEKFRCEKSKAIISSIVSTKAFQEFMMNRDKNDTSFWASYVLEQALNEVCPKNGLEVIANLIEQQPLTFVNNITKKILCDPKIGHNLDFLSYAEALEKLNDKVFLKNAIIEKFFPEVAFFVSVLLGNEITKRDYLETFFSILTVENVNIDDTLFKELNIESLDQDLIFCLAVQCLISNLGIPKFKSNLCALSNHEVETFLKEHFLNNKECFNPICPGLFSLNENPGGGIYAPPWFSI